MKCSDLVALVACVAVIVKAAGTGSPYDNATVFLTRWYVDEVKSAVANMKNATLASQAVLVEQIPVFFWMDMTTKVSIFGDYLSQAAAAASGRTQLVQAVIYDIPDRDCGSNASAGEFTIADGGAKKYQAYIDAIAAQVEKFPSVRVALVVEPDALASLVTDLDIAKCANAESTYKELISYAIAHLQQDNVWLYLDAGSSGWLGWSDSLEPAADLFAEVLRGAGNNATIRGLSTDVSNYNLLRGKRDPVMGRNPNYNEERYINALAPLLQERGVPSQFIVDQSRSGVSGIRSSGENWCNIYGAGMGPRPSTDTGNDLIDSIVWVQPPGESDGTTDPASARYDSNCVSEDAMQPAPEEGTWFQSYFEMLVQNANPPLS